MNDRRAMSRACWLLGVVLSCNSLAVAQDATGGTAIVPQSSAATLRQDEPVAAAATGETASTAEADLPELQARWEFFIPVPIPPTEPTTIAGTPQWVDFILGPSVFAHARLDLGDLRIYDSNGRPIPYALRYLRPQTERERIPAEEFNRSEPMVGPTELTLDLQQDDIQHNEIEIVTNGENFRRAVKVDGSDDGKTWRQLAVGNLIRFAQGEQKINVQSLDYPASRNRYVRILVSPDPEPTGREDTRDEFLIMEVHVLRHAEVPGEELTLAAELGSREPVRTFGAPGSSWMIGLGGPRVPCDRIEVEIADSEFARDIQVEYEMPEDVALQPRFEIASLFGDPLWQRRAGEPKRPIVSRFSEVQTGRLQLRVTDHRNPPLSIRSIKFSAPARQVVFARPASDQTELRLYFGNPEAGLPNYDFARNLPAKLPTTPIRVALGEVQRNPDFVPPPQPFTERFPWLIYVVLGSVSLVLTVIIVSLSRTAIARHDANNGSIESQGTAAAS